MSGPVCSLFSPRCCVDWQVAVGGPHFCGGTMPLDRVPPCVPPPRGGEHARLACPLQLQLMVGQVTVAPSGVHPGQQPVTSGARYVRLLFFHAGMAASWILPFWIVPDGSSATVTGSAMVMTCDASAVVGRLKWAQAMARLPTACARAGRGFRPALGQSHLTGPGSCLDGWRGFQLRGWSPELSKPADLLKLVTNPLT